GGPRAKIARLEKKTREKFGPPENRQGAIEELGEMKTEAAVDALLMRFTIRIDPGITDDEEKARVRALIVEAREAALPAVKRFILNRDEISWPLRALSVRSPKENSVSSLSEVAGRARANSSGLPE